MKKEVLLTTTISIPNYEVIESKGLVFANVVLGANLFSDIAASFTDTFGGTSDSYQGKLDKIYEEVVDKLRRKALDMGCNAIIGFKIDFDELSGKQKSMFMVNAVGTACKARPILASKVAQSSNLLDEEDMEIAVKKYKIVESIKSKDNPKISNETIGYLMNYPAKEVVDELLDYYYVVEASESEYIVGGQYIPSRIQSNINFVNHYIGLFKDEEVIEKVYAKYMENEVYFNIIEQNNIFDCKQVLRIAESDPIKAIKLLSVGKSSYSKEDISYFKQIVNKYENLPNRGTFEMSKAGMFSKSQKQYICEEGHANEEGVEFCKKCGKNIQGLTKEDVQNINDMKLKIEVLEKYFEL